MIKKTAKTPDSLVINQVVISTLNRQSLDIKKYITALKRADSETTPSFVSLYEVYDNLILDSTLRSCMIKRKAQITNKPLAYIVNGKEIDSLKDVLNGNKFREFLSEILDTISFGHTLIQFDYSINTFNYKKIERRNVNPKKGIITLRQYNSDGIDYRNDATLPVLEIFTPDTINKYGLLAAAAPDIIYKRNSKGDWAQHNEIYGQPIREGTYDANDELGREKLSKDMNEMGGSATFLHPKNTELKFIESGDKSGSSDLYHTFNTVNELAITILYLGNNLTTNSGDKGARSLGEIQQKDQKEIICDDKKFLIGVLNSEPFKTYFNLYYPEAKGGVFQFIEDREVDTKTKADVYDIASKYVPIPDKEWYQLMDMSVPENLDQLKAEMKAQIQARNDASQNGNNSDNSNGKSTAPKNKSSFSFFG